MKNLYSVFVLVFAFLTTVLAAQSSPNAQDLNSVLKPPKGSQLAVVVFEDLQCPQCRMTNPVLKDAVKTYKIPLVVHDFPLPMHNWSYQAAVFAHYFDAHSKELGYE